MLGLLRLWQLRAAAEVALAPLVVVGAVAMAVALVVGALQQLGTIQYFLISPTLPSMPQGWSYGQYVPAPV
jgi:preprotein translocase subunit Sec61beta